MVYGKCSEIKMCVFQLILKNKNNKLISMNIKKNKMMDKDFNTIKAIDNCLQQEPRISLSTIAKLSQKSNREKIVNSLLKVKIALNARRKQA